MNRIDVAVRSKSRSKRKCNDRSLDSCRVLPTMDNCWPCVTIRRCPRRELPVNCPPSRLSYLVFIPRRTRLQTLRKQTHEHEMSPAFSGGSPGEPPPTNHTSASTAGDVPKPARFRILLMGRANAGKTTILKKLCGGSAEPIVRNGTGSVSRFHLEFGCLQVSLPWLLDFFQPQELQLNPTAEVSLTRKNSFQARHVLTRATLCREADTR